MTIQLKDKSFINIINQLFHATIQLHIWHLQTDSYAQHKALESFYNELPKFIDLLVETVQGKSTIQKGYKLKEFLDYKNKEEIVIYLLGLNEHLEIYRNSLTKSWANVDNQIQVIIDHVESTIYKLRFLI